MPVAPTFDQPAMAQPVQIARDGLWRQRSYPEKGHPAFPPIQQLQHDNKTAGITQHFQDLGRFSHKASLVFS